MANMNYAFFDTETTGADPFFDQCLQIAIVTTDNELNANEPIDLRARPDAHVIPNPQALCVTNIKYSDALKAPLSHDGLTGKIDNFFKENSPSIIIGHNIINFDIPILRQMNYKTARDPYTTSQNGNQIIDTLPMIRAWSALRPDTIKLGWNEDLQRPSFRLDELSVLNGMEHGNAHDALADVIPCIEFCKMMEKDDPVLYKKLVSRGNQWKNRDLISDEGTFAFITRNGPVKIVPVTPIGINPENDKEYLVWDVSASSDQVLDFANTDISEIVDSLKDSDKKALLPIHKFSINKMPIIFPLKDIFPSKEASEYKKKGQEIADNFKLRKMGPQILKQYGESFDNGTELENRIYESFLSNADKRRSEQMHSLSNPVDRWKIAGTFEDTRYRALARRNEFLKSGFAGDEKTGQIYKTGIYNRLKGENDPEKDEPWLRIGTARKMALEMLEKEDLSVAHKEILEDYLPTLDMVEQALKEPYVMPDKFKDDAIKPTPKPTSQQIKARRNGQEELEL